eukprot:3076522-Alexandrium_andersonii.AAC.1
MNFLDEYGEGLVEPAPAPSAPHPGHGSASIGQPGTRQQWNAKRDERGLPRTILDIGWLLEVPWRARPDGRAG